MRKLTILSVILLFFLALASGCASNKSCSKKGKTRVPMGHM
jgi:ABC-type oligopeptide transport system substrate-binding subunit